MFNASKMSKSNNFTYDLNPPPLDQLARCFAEELPKHFQKCDVTVVQCPDLTKSPFNLAAPGIGGSTAIADVGGVPNLVPLVKREKIYSFLDVAKHVNIGERCTIIGASAGPFHTVGTNCEMMPNLLLEKDGDNYKIIKNLSTIAKINSDDGYCLKQELQPEFGLLGNFFISEGKQSAVLKIEAEQRNGPMGSITELIQKILKENFPDQPISMGGVFLLEKGKANLHIMPDFSSKPLKSDQEVNEWLRFFDFQSPLICLTTLHSIDPGHSLRMEHTHCFSDHNQGGHYHYDTTPDQVRYVAYLNVAQRIVRIDKQS